MVIDYDMISVIKRPEGHRDARYADEPILIDRPSVAQEKAPGLNERLAQTVC